MKKKPLENIRKILKRVTIFIVRIDYFSLLLDKPLKRSAWTTMFSNVS